MTEKTNKLDAVVEALKEKTKEITTTVKEFESVEQARYEDDGYYFVDMYYSGNCLFPNEIKRLDEIGLDMISQTKNSKHKWKFEFLLTEYEAEKILRE